MNFFLKNFRLTAEVSVDGATKMKLSTYKIIQINASAKKQMTLKKRGSDHIRIHDNTLAV